MLNRARALAEKKGWRMAGLAPSASAAQTLAAEAGIPTETLQMFLARNAGVAEGRLTRKGAREMRAAFAKTILVVDEGSLASTVQARDLLRIASVLRIPRVVMVGDAKQLDAVDAGKPFAQLQAAGMQTATMDEIMRQRDPALKEAVEASLKGDIARAFEKLGSNVAEVKPDNIAGAVAARWLRLDADARENTGVMAPSHELRQAINGHIRERLAREGRIHGPAMESERLVSKGYTNAEKALAGNYAAGDVVAFHRPYKRIGVEKGDERRVMGVDHKARAVLLDDGKGGRVAWKPEEIGGRRGGSEVYRAEEIELRAGDRIRWTRNDAGLGLVNSRTAEVVGIANGRVTFRLEDGKTLELGRADPQLRHLDHAWASTVHAFQGRTVDNVIAAMEARHPHLTTQKSFYVEISRARDRAELVTDDAAELRAQLQAATGERIAALEGIGEMKREAPDKATTGKDRETAELDGVSRTERGAGEGAGKARQGPKTPAKTPEAAGPRPRQGRHGPWIVTIPAAPPPGRARLAVLIDGENASPRHARAVFEGAQALGEATVRRIYGDFSNGRLASWNAAIRNFAIVPCHQPAHVRGKNAADIALAIDAVDLTYRARLDGFLLVSSDSDFTRLAQRLREGGFAVFGFGESKAPRAFRSACHRFEIVGRAATGTAAAPGRGA